MKADRAGRRWVGDSDAVFPEWVGLHPRQKHDPTRYETGDGRKNDPRAEYGTIRNTPRYARKKRRVRTPCLTPCAHIRDVHVTALVRSSSTKIVIRQFEKLVKGFI